MFSTLDSTRVFPFVAIAYRLPLGTTVALPDHSQPQIRGQPTAALSCSCVSSLQVKTFHEFISSYIPDDMSLLQAETQRAKTGCSFALSLCSTRVSFRGLLAQNHLSTKSAAHSELKPLHLQDEVHLAPRVRLVHRQLMSSKVFP